jgi:WXXGXW repeat (2 copies)
VRHRTDDALRLMDHDSWKFHFNSRSQIMTSATDRTAFEVQAVQPTTARGSMSRVLRNTMLSLIVAGGIASGPAFARTIIVEVAPPPARVEVVPVQRHGYTWAPGYWSHPHNQYVWVNGHSMRTRTGYQWTPDRWNQVDGRHQYQAGSWTRGNDSHGQ